jgi:hypothetical protein
MAIKYTNISLLRPQNYTKFGIFGMQIYIPSGNREAQVLSSWNEHMYNQFVSNRHMARIIHNTLTCVSRIFL